MRRSLRGKSALALALLALPLAASCDGRAARTAQRPRAAVLILLDTVRPDRLGCYGYHERPTSPRIDAFAARGVLFEQAISHAPWTLASMVSLLSGQPDDSAFEGKLQRSLIQTFQAAGFRTAAFTEGAFVSRKFGIDLGFESFHQAKARVTEDGEGKAQGISVTFALARAWLAEHKDEPFLLLVHTYEAHMPYVRTRFAAGMERGVLPEVLDVATVDRVNAGELELGEVEHEYMGALYDGGIAECDRHVGELLDDLERLGLRERTVVAITSDHGEQLGEPQLPRFAADHGHALYDHLLRIPLLLDPVIDVRPQRVPAQVRSMDILPTLADLLGVEPPSWSEGKSLVPLMRGEERAGRPAWGGGTEVGPPRAFLRLDGFKLIEVTGPVVEDARFPALQPLELFDLEGDAQELRSLARDDPRRLESMRQVLDLLRRGRETSGELRIPGDLDPELEQQLRSLGYLR